METTPRPLAPEVVVDGLSGASFRNGLVKLNFFTGTFDGNDKAEKIVPNVTLVTSVPDLIAMKDYLVTLVGFLQEQGVIRVATVNVAEKEDES